MRHPLGIALGSSWRWEHSGSIVTVAHPLDVQAAIPVRALLDYADEVQLWDELAEQLKDKLRDGWAGRLVFAEIVQE